AARGGARRQWGVCRPDGRGAGGARGEPRLGARDGVEEAPRRAAHGRIRAGGADHSLYRGAVLPILFRIAVWGFRGSIRYVAPVSRPASPIRRSALRERRRSPDRRYLSKGEATCQPTIIPHATARGTR